MRTASLVHIGGWGKRDGALPHIFFQNPGNPTVLFYYCPLNFFVDILFKKRADSIMRIQP